MLSLVGMLLCLFAQAALPVAGKYYRFVNVGRTNVLYEDFQRKVISCDRKNTDNYAQVWLYTGRALQNVYTGHYLQPQTSQSKNFEPGFTAPATNVSFSETADGNLLINCGGYIHCDGSNNAVNWYDTNNAGNHWTIEPVSLTDERVQELRAEYEQYAEGESAFVEKLNRLQNADYTKINEIFADESCSKLNSKVASMTDDQLMAAVVAAGLPKELGEVAVKVKNGWADETDASMSSEFRVQSYGAYAAADKWRWNSADGKGLNASQIGDMNNPTGIYTTGRDLLYVFVEGDIPAGTELRLSHVNEGITGFDKNNWNQGTVLHKGVNVVGTEDQLQEHWVMYTVTDKNLKPAELPKLKIHVEGGHVLGYVTYDPKDEAGTNARYERILKAANKSADASGADKCRLRLALMGEYGVSYWQIMTYNLIWSDYEESLFSNTPSCTFETEKFNKRNQHYGYKIWKAAKFYDDVLHQEWATMGFMKDVAEATAQNPVYNCYGGLDLYPTYCNCRAITIMGTKGGNPHSSTGYTHMPGVGAVESSYNGERADFDVWCVGHESGHNNQGAINLQSSTESSNNLFSQIITYFYGYRMGRGGSMADNEDYYQKGTQFSLRDIGMTMRMYYNLYLYYHTAGKKCDFYPTLFTLLRADALNLRSAKDSWLKFYQKACQAAGEDLTEYFRLWGFFEPFQNTTFGDYTSYTLSLTQNEINQAINAVKAEAAEKGWRENLEIMFIEDRQQLRERTDLWAATATGESNGVSKTMKPDNSGTWRNQDYLHQQFGTMGDVNDFLNPQPATDFNYCVSGTSVTVNGKGGVGLLIYDKDGKIVAHANNANFTIPASLATAGFTIKAVNADGTTAEVKDIMEVGTADDQLAALQMAVNATTQYTRLKDPNGKRVGCYKPETLSEIESVVANAKTAITNKDAAQYKPLFENINSEMLKLADESSMINLEDGGIYVIESARNSGRFISYTGTTLQTGTTSSSDVARWAFIPADKTSNSFYLQNAGKDYRMVVQYPYATTNANDVTGWGVTTNFSKTDSLFACRLKSAGDGKWFLQTKDGGKCINVDGSNNTRLVPWGEDEGSKFYITQYKVIDAYSAEDLQQLIEDNKSLVQDVCDYEIKNNKLVPQVDDKNAPNYVYTNQPEVDAAYANNGIDKLIDGKATTWFTTKRVNNKATAYHYVAIDLGEGNGTENFKFYLRKYTNNGEADNAPAKILVKARNTTTEVFKDMATVVPAYSAQGAYTSPEILADQPYRYWQMQVTMTNNADAGKVPFFSVAFMNFYAVQENIALHSGYESLDKSLISATVNTQNAAQTALNGFLSPLTLEKPYLNLKATYEALLEAAGKATGIDGVEAEETTTADMKAANGIFDLSGRRVSKAAKKGVYIVNGKKVLY